PSPLRLTALLQHARVRAVELQLDLVAPARELADLPAPARADAVDLAVHAGKLELKALHLEHVRALGLATRFHDELGDQCAELRVVLGQAARRRVQVPAEMLRHATQTTVAEVLTEVELGERLRTGTRAGDAEREKHALGARAARCQRGSRATGSAGISAARSAAVSRCARSRAHASGASLAAATAPIVCPPGPLSSARSPRPRRRIAAQRALHEARRQAQPLRDD